MLVSVPMSVFLPKKPKTYHVGLLQARAYRVLKSETARVLRPYKIGSVEWTILGLLNDNQDGLKVSVLANTLGVRMPFMTNTVHLLVKRGYVSRSEGEGDRRTKVVRLTPEGKDLIDKVEPELRKEMKPLFMNIPATKLLSYFMVLKKIVGNANEENVETSKDLETYRP